MKISALATVLCLAPATDAFVVAPPSARAAIYSSSSRSAASSHTTKMMASPLPAAAAALTNAAHSSALLIASDVAEPGSVQAPGWVLPAAAVTVILTAGIIPLLLKPGDDAAKDMQERDEAMWEQNKKL